MSGVKAFLESLREEPRAPKRSRGRKASPFEVAIDEARRAAESGEWERARGVTMVGLYAVCHEMVYRVLPEELQDKGTFSAAARRSGAMLRERFGGDPAAMARFVKWCWAREKGRAEWAKREGKQRNRLSWQLQFSASLLTDYRAAAR